VNKDEYILARFYICLFISVIVYMILRPTLWHWRVYTVLMG